jgi:hypothetical protein
MGDVTSAITVSRPTFDASGVRLGITGLECHVSVVEHWCPDEDPKCRRDPTSIRHEPATCPANAMPGNFSLHTPWGQVYSSKLVAGQLDVKIDWNSAAVDVVDGQALRKRWSVHADDGAVDVDAHLHLTDDEVDALLAAVREATGNDYRDAAAGERAVLTATFSNEPTGNGENHVTVSVTNRGPAPAYRVVAQLKSGAPGLQGLRISFGRIDTSETKKRAKDITTPGDVDEPLSLEVTASNAAPTAVSDRIQLKAKRVSKAPPPRPAAPPASPELSCSAPPGPVTAGQRVRIACEASNPGDGTVKGATYAVSGVDTAPVPVLGPTDLPPHTLPIKFDVDVAVPAGAAPGPLRIGIAATAQGASPAEQEVTVDVFELHKLCKPGELTIEDYRRKQRLLDREWAAGEITKEKRNDYLAELWTCVRH